MICLLLIMTMIFINGIESVEQKVRRAGTGLREEEMNAKTKAWLLMVESGKVDEEDLRKITPKSIFIAPLLSGQTAKCKEGYRHDHLGQCVKVIKIDPKAQLELLLKRLNMLYGEKKEEEEERPVEQSSGPLHFSIPLFNESDKEKPKDEEKSNRTSMKKDENSPELIPIPLPMLMLSRTNQTDHISETSQFNQTKEIESSGMEPLNDTESCETSLLEGSGFASGDSSPEMETTSSPVTLISEETDYIDVTETETTVKITTTVDTSTEMSTTTIIPFEDTNSKESYHSITDIPSVNDSIVELPTENVQTPEILTNTSNSDVIHFPNDEKERTFPSPFIETSYIRFPDDPPQPKPFTSYQPTTSRPKLNPELQIQPSAIPRQQFWWVPDNWKIDESQQKSTLVKFWSRLPLIHDVSYSGDNGFKSFIVNNRPPQPQHQPLFHPKSQSQPQSHLLIPQQRNQELTIGFSDQLSTPPKEKPFRNSRFQEILVPSRETFRIQR